MTLVEAILEATPVPVSTDPETLLAEFAAMHSRREAILVAAPRVPPTDDDRALLAELHERETAWYEALLEARNRVREQRVLASKLKFYTAGAE